MKTKTKICKWHVSTHYRCICHILELCCICLIIIKLYLDIFQIPSKENIETLSAMDIAEQMTYIDHQIFVSIRSE